MASPIEEIKQLLENENASPEFSEAILAYAGNLYAKQLPILWAPIDLSAALQLPMQEFKTLLNDRDKQYRLFGMAKKRGGFRFIMAPMPKLKLIQKWILFAMLSKIETHPNSYGFVKGQTISNNAMEHIGATFLVQFDLWKFFDSINERRVFGLFKSIGYGSDIAFDLAKLCCAKPPARYWKKIAPDDQSKSRLNKSKDGILPQGAPTSPAIANMLARKLDKRLSGLATKFGLKYSRYADDITFSSYSNSTELAFPLVSIVRKIVEEEGFYLNEEKTRLRYPHQCQLVTGLVVNEKVNIRREVIREIFTHLHYSRKYGPLAHMENIAWKSGDFQEWLGGKISFVHSVRPDIAVKMWQRYNEINWIELEYPDLALAEKFHSGESATTFFKKSD